MGDDNDDLFPEFAELLNGERNSHTGDQYNWRDVNIEVEALNFQSDKVEYRKEKISYEDDSVLPPYQPMFSWEKNSVKIASGIVVTAALGLLINYLANFNSKNRLNFSKSSAQPLTLQEALDKLHALTVSVQTIANVHAMAVNDVQEISSALSGYLFLNNAVLEDTKQVENIMNSITSLNHCVELMADEQKRQLQFEGVHNKLSANTKLDILLQISSDLTRVRDGLQQKLFVDAKRHKMEILKKLEEAIQSRKLSQIIENKALLDAFKYDCHPLYKEAKDVIREIYDEEDAEERQQYSTQHQDSIETLKSSFHLLASTYATETVRTIDTIPSVAAIGAAPAQSSTSLPVGTGGAEAVAADSRIDSNHKQEDIYSSSVSIFGAAAGGEVTPHAQRSTTGTNLHVSSEWLLEVRRLERDHEKDLREYRQRMKEQRRTREEKAERRANDAVREREEHLMRCKLSLALLTAQQQSSTATQHREVRAEARSLQAAQVLIHKQMIAGDKVIFLIALGLGAFQYYRVYSTCSCDRVGEDQPSVSNEPMEYSWVWSLKLLFRKLCAALDNCAAGDMNDIDARNPLNADGDLSSAGEESAYISSGFYEYIPSFSTEGSASIVSAALLVPQRLVSIGLSSTATLLTTVFGGNGTEATETALDCMRLAFCAFNLYIRSVPSLIISKYLGRFTKFAELFAWLALFWGYSDVIVLFASSTMRPLCFMAVVHIVVYLAASKLYIPSSKTGQIVRRLLLGAVYPFIFCIVCGAVGCVQFRAGPSCLERVFVASFTLPQLFLNGHINLVECIKHSMFLA